MAMSTEPRPFDGVWGPYFGVALAGLWVCEGGQSATGALLDHLIRWHGAGGEPDAAMHQRIAARVQELRRAEGPELAARLHVLPDFHGNRSPLADPHAVGVVSGLTLDATFDSLCKLYWRSCVGIALGVRHILEALNERGYVIDTLHVTGGHTRNPLLMELYGDATGCTVVEPQAADAVLLGTAMVAAAAAGLYPDLPSACLAMQQGGAGARRPTRRRARASTATTGYSWRCTGSGASWSAAVGAGMSVDASGVCSRPGHSCRGPCVTSRTLPVQITRQLLEPALQLAVVARQRRQLLGERRDRWSDGVSPPP